jgi:hypothetical protein
MSLTSLFNFLKNRKNKKKDDWGFEPFVISSVARKRNMSAEDRMKAATESLDTFSGFGLPYVRGSIKNSIKSPSVKDNMMRIAVCLPLLKKFITSVSRVYNMQPVRKFFLDGKQIVKDIKNFQNAENYIVDEKLFNLLSGLYSKEIDLTLQQAEQFTNLLSTTVYKITTDEIGQVRMDFIANDITQVISDEDRPSNADKIAFLLDFYDEKFNMQQLQISEVWSAEKKKIYNDELNQVDLQNNAANESLKLFDSKKTGFAFAPFVVFRSGIPTGSFWDNKDGDVLEYIKAINMSITELRYLARYASFGLKYTVGIKVPDDGLLDATGILQFGQERSGVGGRDTKDWEVGEFSNSGRIKEVIESIIFNMKMLFVMYNLALDSLISSNSVRSAENKQLDNEELFSTVNSQRDIWELNELNLFKVLCSVHNRDNLNKIPKGIDLQVDFEIFDTDKKTNEDWMVEIHNHISSVLDWLAEKRPELNVDELKKLYIDNMNVNSNLGSAEKEDEEEDEDEKITKK